MDYIKSNYNTRQGMTIIVWIAAFLIIASCSYPIGRVNPLAVFISITFIIAFCILFTLFARYADSDRFPKTAIFNIGMC
jgi:hypothetical protein